MVPLLASPCVNGTVGSSIFLDNVSECTQCPGGHYCDKEQMIWFDIWSSVTKGLLF